MASKYDRLRQQRGISTGEATPVSKYDNYREARGIQTISTGRAAGAAAGIATTLQQRPDPPPAKMPVEGIRQNIGLSEPTTQRAAYDQLMDARPTSPLQQTVKETNAQAVQSQPQQRRPESLGEALSSTFKQAGRNLAEPFRAVNRASEALALAATRNLGPEIGRREDGSYGALPNTDVGQRIKEQMGERTSVGPVADKVLDFVGEAGAYVMPVPGSSNPIAMYNNPAVQRLAQAAGSRFNRPLAQKVAQEATREASTAAAWAVPSSLIRGETEPGEIARNVAIEGGLGAATGAALPVISAGVKNALGRLFQRTQNPQVQELLALPEPRTRGQANTATPPDVIPARGSVEPIGLPEPQLATPTTARAASPSAEYRRKFETLIDEANKRTMTPGHELEELESLWSTMAGPQDPGLDELITLAYRPVDRANQRLRNMAPDALQRGRDNLRMREAAGAPPLVRSTADRYNPPLSSAAMPVERVGAARLADSALPISPASRGLQDAGGRLSRVAGQVEEVAPVPRTPEAPIENSFQPPTFSDNLREIGQDLAGDQRLGISAFAKQSPYDALSTDTKSQLATKLDKAPFSAKESANRLYTNFIDDVHRMNQFDRFAEQILGDLNPTQRSHNLALASRGSDIIARQNLLENLVDIDGNVIGKSLKERLAPLPRNAYVDFEKYLINQHAITRFDRGEKVFDDALNWTPDTGREVMAQMEAKYPMFKQVADDFRQYHRQMVEHWWVDTGLMTQKQADAMFEQNPFYVPMKRQFSDLEKGSATGAKAKRGFIDQKAPVKGYSKTGSQRKIISPVETTIEMTDASIKAAKRNEVLKTVYEAIKRDPKEFRDWAEVVTNKPYSVPKNETPEDMLLRLNEEFENATRVNNLDKDNIVTAMVNGKPVHLQINDKQLLEALSALNPYGQNALVDALGKVTRVFKVLTTGANPIFGLTRNLSRDISQAFISRRNSNLRQFGSDLVESFVAAIGNRKLYQSYKNVGGGHSSPVAANRNLLAESKRAILPSNPIKTAVPKAFSQVENFMNALESVPRLGEFKRAGMQTPDQRLKGLMDAQDVTTNFKRRGRIGGQVDQVFPYFNAAMQGLDKIARIYRDNPVKALQRTFMGITVPTLALYALNFDNPDYQKVSKYQRDNFFLIPKGDGTFVRVAKHRELGIPFSAAVERALDTWLKEDPEAFREFANAVRVAFLPPGLSGLAESGSVTDRLVGGVLGDTILGPIAEVASNKNFTGAPIVPADLQRLSPEHQYDERTSEVSKAISNFTRRVSDRTGVDITTSPKQLDHLIRSYTGVLGQFGLPATTQNTSLLEALEKQVIVDPVYSNDTLNRFYDIKETLDRAKADSRHLGEAARGFNPAMQARFNQVNDLLANLRAMSKQIERSDMPADEKEVNMREIRERMNELAEEANRVYRESK